MILIIAKIIINSAYFLYKKKIFQAINQRGRIAGGGSGQFCCAHWIIYQSPQPPPPVRRAAEATTAVHPP